MTTLLIWDEIGEDLKLYRLQPSPKDQKKLNAIHGEWVNGGLDPQQESWILKYLQDYAPAPFYTASRGEQIPADHHFVHIVVSGIA